MGSLFAAPKQAAPAPLPPLPIEEDGDEAERKRRLDALARKRRGRAGLIKTSARGLLSEVSKAQINKNLLGE